MKSTAFLFLAFALAASSQNSHAQFLSTKAATNLALSGSEVPVAEALVADTVAVDSLELDSLVVEALEIDSLKSESIELDSLVVEALELDSLIVEPIMADTLAVEAVVADTVVVEPVVVEPVVVEPVVVEPVVVEPVTVVVIEPVVIEGEVEDLSSFLSTEINKLGEDFVKNHKEEFIVFINKQLESTDVKLEEDVRAEIAAAARVMKLNDKLDAIQTEYITGDKDKAMEDAKLASTEYDDILSDDRKEWLERKSTKVIEVKSITLEDFMAKANKENKAIFELLAEKTKEKMGESLRKWKIQYDLEQKLSADKRLVDVSVNGKTFDDILKEEIKRLIEEGKSEEEILERTYQLAVAKIPGQEQQIKELQEEIKELQGKDIVSCSAGVVHAKEKEEEEEEVVELETKVVSLEDADSLTDIKNAVTELIKKQMEPILAQQKASRDAANNSNNQVMNFIKSKFDSPYADYNANLNYSPAWQDQYLFNNNINKLRMENMFNSIGYNSPAKEELVNPNVFNYTYNGDYTNMRPDYNMGMNRNYYSGNNYENFNNSYLDPTRFSSDPRRTNLNNFSNMRTWNFRNSSRTSASIRQAVVRE